MSPEQVRGEEVDGQSDVFAVGAVLYELLAGRRAFPGETVGAVLAAVLGREPEPLSSLNPAIPEALSRVVSRMLEKERARRTPSMRAAVDELAAARRGQLPAGSRGTSGASVAVVTFTNISARPEDEWLGTGLAETLAAELRCSAGPAVVASERVHEMVRRLVAERGADGGEIAEEAGRRLGVRWVATGGFQRVGDRLRITARLADAGTGEVVRSLKADGDLAELFDLQDRLADDLVLAYREASGSAAAFAPAAEETRVVAAYEAYSKGLINLRVGSVTSLDRAALFLERATLLDPRYVAAHISLGWALQDKAEYVGLVEPAEKALAAFGRALELRPSSAEACRGLAYTLLFLRRDDEALAAARKAQALAPGEAAAHQALARVLFVAKGEFLEAARAYEAALALNPQGGWIALQLAHCLALAGELPRADAVARRAIELQDQALSGKEGLLIVGAHVRLAHVHALEGRFEEAVSELHAERRHLASVDHALAGRALVELHVRLGSALRKLGRESEAEEALEAALSRFEERLAQGADDPFTRYYAAQALVLRGETARALELLAGAAALRPALTLRRVLLEPDFEPLSASPGSGGFSRSTGSRHQPAGAGRAARPDRAASTRGKSGPASFRDGRVSMGIRRTVMKIATCLVMSPLLVAALAAAQPRSPHDVTTYGVVYRVPGMQDALLRPGLPFGDGDRTMDVTLPPGAKGKPVPAVVFANVTGAPYGTWGDLPRLGEARGGARHGRRRLPLRSGEPRKEPRRGDGAPRGERGSARRRCLPGRRLGLLRERLARSPVAHGEPEARRRGCGSLRRLGAAGGPARPGPEGSSRLLRPRGTRQPAAQRGDHARTSRRR